MKIDIPYEIGDPIIYIDYNQHDGYYIEYQGFQYRDLEHLDMIFSDYKAAQKKMDDLNRKVTK